MREPIERSKEQSGGPRGLRGPLQQEGLYGGRRVLVARLYSAQRAHRPGAGRPVRPYQEHPADAEIRAGDDRGRRGYRDRPRAVLGFGAPVNWIAADILRVEGGLLVEHWDVIQDEATREQSKSGNPMFGKTFPVYS